LANALSLFDAADQEIIRIAGLIGRTPDAVTMKLSNFASFDPYHQPRGGVGLQNASKADREIWKEFNDDWNQIAVESEAVYQQTVREGEYSRIR
jgi:hypothetical protein